MYRKTLPELKRSAPFYVFDLLIYLLSITLIALLFITGVFSGNKADAVGVNFIYDNELAAEFRFSDGVFTVKDGYESYFLRNGNEICFYPNAQNKNDYNIIIINCEEKTVYIKDATCAGRDCLTQKITGGKGFIYCAPHKLKITPMGLTTPVTG